MGKVLVEASKVTCGTAPPHKGSIGMTGAARLVVGGSKVLTTASVFGPATKTPFPGCTNPGDSSAPCTKIATMSGGAATRLKVDGEFVVLDSLKGTTDKAGGIVTVDSTSIKNDRLEAE
jgi:hypothetical protein